ncbi:MAG: (d)CMP kinase [candidate division Zixibacteria bacterium]|nr:(d)CMP kinase [candidate division Zixibacteria bacterium]
MSNLLYLKDMAHLNSNLFNVKQRIIAIDGPSGSGKSTTAKLVAARLGYQYLDTGAMYRALTFIATRNHIPPSDGVTLTKMAFEMVFEFQTTEAVNRVFVNGEEVTSDIRTPEITRLVSEVSAHKGVREAMVAKQVEIGKTGGIVAEGRDTTTVVFPHAEIKVYLEASVDARARRRLLDIQRMNLTSSVEEQIADLERRDAYDSGRTHSPLTRAADAVIVDTTNLTIEDQVIAIVDLLKSVPS